ncbi:WD-40 repeat protein [Reticulomyxa filosa]|uniref:WD-40 repeat protein n=1 Tax=Reticulomyxa filosa TaxID=46433 RepID=X6P4V3_RETFI|nr:WD-40 repeat protein [Reticulomyxa filosa]|eukprot:ETO32617.1 WD-40 repeat protein [Reticulomyxa filosa]
MIGGNGYAVCSGSFDTTIRVWDIAATKQSVILTGHQYAVNTVKYGSNESGISGNANTILSGSNDCSVRLWDIRSGQQIQVFKGHTNEVNTAEYSPFVVNNNKVGGGNVICSGSWDNTIRFWGVRSNKKELYVIEGDDKEDGGILCLKFLGFKKKEKNNENKKNSDYSFNLCYGSAKGPIRVWE